MPAGKLSKLSIKIRRTLGKNTIAPPTTASELLEAESDLGASLFGPIPENVDRKFFHSTKKNVWIWHEDGTTVRYEVHPHGVYKRIGNGPLEKLKGDELSNFRSATHQYLQTVKTRLYKVQQQKHLA